MTYSLIKLVIIMIIIIIINNNIINYYIILSTLKCIVKAWLDAPASNAFWYRVTRVFHDPSLCTAFNIHRKLKQRLNIRVN